MSRTARRWEFTRNVRSFVVPRAQGAHITHAKQAYHENQRFSISRATKLLYITTAQPSISRTTKLLYITTAQPSISRLHRSQIPYHSTQVDKGVYYVKDFPRACNRICSRNHRTLLKDKRSSRIHKTAYSQCIAKTVNVKYFIFLHKSKDHIILLREYVHKSKNSLVQQ